jgi:hypothetical protein
LGGGALVFVGVLICPSNPYFNVPFYTYCGFGGAGKELGSSVNRLRYKGPGGVSGGVAGAGFRCSGIKCREDLAGPESGLFGQIGPVFGFHETTSSGGHCDGFGAGPDVGIFGGVFRCTTIIGESIGGSGP